MRSFPRALPWPLSPNASSSQSRMPVSKRCHSTRPSPRSTGIGARSCWGQSMVASRVARVTMPPPPRPSIAPSKPVMPAARPSGPNPMSENLRRPVMSGSRRLADVRDGQVETAQFAARGKRRDPLAQAARPAAPPPAPRGSRCGPSPRAPRAATKCPSLRVSRASRLAVRQGAPGRDSSRSVASTEIVLVVPLHADVAGNAREHTRGLRAGAGPRARAGAGGSSLRDRCRARRRESNRGPPPARESCPAASPPIHRGRGHVPRPGRARRSCRCRRAHRPPRPRCRSRSRGARAGRRARSA